jgi:hypothetical protein
VNLARRLPLRIIPYGALAPYADVDKSARQEVIVAWPVDECRRLCTAEGSSLHLRKGESGLAELVELGKIGAGLDDVDLGVCTDVCEAELVNLAEQRSALGQGQAREGDMGRLGGGGPYRVGVADPHAEVWFLEHQPSAGSQPGDYPSQQVHAGGNVHEHCSGVYEIERARRKRIGADVVSKDLDVRDVYLGQEAQLQVGGDHPPGRADDFRQPPGDRPPPPTDFQAPSALADPKTLNAPLGKGVETLLQQLKTARFVPGGMRERVVRCLTHSQNRKLRLASGRYQRSRQPARPGAP